MIRLVSILDQLLEGSAERELERFPEAALYERAFSGARRQELAKKGKAMPGGGYPIENGGDLKNAIRAVGRASDPAAAKRWIIKRAKALGLTSQLPESWNADDKGGDSDRDGD